MKHRTSRNGSEVPMGDSYREEIKRNHTKSGFGPDSFSHTGGRPRTLSEERRALRRDYFKAQKGHPSPARQKGLLDA